MLNNIFCSASLLLFTEKVIFLRFFLAVTRIIAKFEQQ
jgi:hypothetical protein